MIDAGTLIGGLCAAFGAGVMVIAIGPALVADAKRRWQEHREMTAWRKRVWPKRQRAVHVMEQKLRFIEKREREVADIETNHNPTIH